MLSAVLRRSGRSGRLLRVPRAPHTALRGVISSQVVICDRRFFATTAKDEEEPPQRSGVLESVVSENPAQTAKESTFRVGDDWTRPVWKSKVVPALRTFKEVKGNLLVPRSFQVPWGDTRWPKAAWGYQLGIAVKRLRNQQRNAKRKLPVHVVDDLMEMEFVWNVSQFKWDFVFMPALRRFHEINGHTDVPNRFVIANDDEDWQKLSRGLNFGYMVHRIRSKNWFATQVATSSDELGRLGFVSDSTLCDRDWKEKVLPSLETFYHEYGHCIVGNLFVVPSTRWPEKAWEMRLGSVVNSIRCNGRYATQVARDQGRLVQLRFAWGRSDAVWQERVLPALVTFAAKFGHCRVPSHFEVPHEASWPEQAHGLGLGRIMENIVSRDGTYFTQVERDSDLLEEIGYAFRLHPKAWEQRVSPLLATYETLFPGEQIPKDFVIPSTSQWPKKRWGVRLGIIVSHNPHYLRSDPTEG